MAKLPCGGRGHSDKDSNLAFRPELGYIYAIAGNALGSVFAHARCILDILENRAPSTMIVTEGMIGLEYLSFFH